jgi:predicted nucleic acid-binding protein
VDTNIIFSAMIRESITRRIILSDVFELYVPEYLFSEIEMNKNLILNKAKISDRDFTLLLTLFQKHVKIVKKEVYQDKIPLAEETMEEIDITDSPFLALALALNCPLWSNDGHFKKQNLVKTYTTKKIVEFLEKQN